MFQILGLLVLLDMVHYAKDFLILVLRILMSGEANLSQVAVLHYLEFVHLFLKFITTSIEFIDDLYLLSPIVGLSRLVFRGYPLMLL